MATESSRQLGLYESKTASTWSAETVTGSHLFKVTCYSLDNGIGIGKCITSAIFTIGGYDWVIKYYPDGISENRKDYLSFYLELKSDATMVKARFNFTMLHHNGSPSTLSHTSPIHTFNHKGQSWGYPEFVERTIFEASDNLQSDCFTIMCTVTVVKPPHLRSEFENVVVPPSNINQQLCQLLETGEGADVTFQVNNHSFKAHKNVLAARSPVFRAQFFGPMNEKGENNVKIENVEAEVFRVFLQFIYSDLVPGLKETTGECEEQDPMIMYQHLLVIADRYEVDRLKLICEKKLSQNIEVKNFATTLTLAEQHNCSQLKASCFKFASSPKVLAAIMESDGYEHLTQSFASILIELVKNLCDK